MREKFLLSDKGYSMGTTQVGRIEAHLAEVVYKIKISGHS